MFTSYMYEKLGYKAYDNSLIPRIHAEGTGDFNYLRGIYIRQTLSHLYIYTCIVGSYLSEEFLFEDFSVVLQLLCNCHAVHLGVPRTQTSQRGTYVERDLTTDLHTGCKDYDIVPLTDLYTHTTVNEKHTLREQLSTLTPLTNNYPIYNSYNGTH